MFCPQCGKAHPEKVNFCFHCGAAMFTPTAARTKLALSRRNKKIAGVCGGVAEYLEVDATLVRLAWVMMALFGGWGLLGYLVAWIIIPEEPSADSARATAPLATQQPAQDH